MINLSAIKAFLPHALSETNFDFLGERYVGKVRDVYMPNPQERILIATDRQSAFDVKWCSIPLKGQVLSQLSAWWFDQIKDIMPTHILSVPDPNVTVAKTVKILQVEVIVRAYLTGSTSTSAWVNYSKGVRNFCGNALPDGMRKHQKFDAPIITPTTKGEHDELIDPAGIVANGLATQSQWDELADRAMAVFKRGQEVARKHGLILVDTKYEMGLDENGVITIADEVHTPDSSRYWIADTYDERMAQGKDPESLDKEFFRLWITGLGLDPYKPEDQEKIRAAITDDVRVMLASKYIDLYERMTGLPFSFPPVGSVVERIEKNLRAWRSMDS